MEESSANRISSAGLFNVANAYNIANTANRKNTIAMGMEYRKIARRPKIMAGTTVNNVGNAVKAMKSIISGICGALSNDVPHCCGGRIIFYKLT